MSDRAEPTRLGPTRPKRRHLKVLGRPLGFEHWALLPLLLFLLLFVAYPLAELVRMGFSTVTLAGGTFNWEFSGLENLRKMLQDELFANALVNMLLFVAATTLGQLIFGTLLAVLVDKSRFLSGIARNVLIWPAIIAPVAVSVTWWLILTPQFGALNYLLEQIGLPQQGWLASSTWALWTVAVVDIWHWTPMVFLIVLAGLTGIDRTLYEAAKVDGASELTVFWRITLPLLIPTLVVAALVRTVLGFKTFDEVYLLTGGGPGNSSEVLSTYIQGLFFEQGNMGYGASLGLTVIAIFVVSFVVFTASRSITREVRKS